MAIQVPFPIPSSGYALNSKLRVNLDFIVSKFNEFNTGTATWDTVAVGTANNLTGTITFYNSSNTNYLTLQAGVTGASITYTLPIAAPGGTARPLISTAAGVMSWGDQAVQTTSSPTFAGLTLSGFSGNVRVLTSSALQTVTELTNSQGVTAMLIASSASTPKFVKLLGTSNQVTVTFNTDDTTLSLPQSIGTSSDVQFGSVRTSNGSTSAPAVRLAGSTTGIYFPSSSAIDFVVDGTPLAELDSSGNFFATTGQIRGGTLRSLGAGTFDATSNQLILGTTRTVTLTAPTPASASRTVTFPDLSADYSVVGTAGTQTIGGAKTFSSALTISASSGSTFVVNTLDLVVDSTNGYVGIGRSNPELLLDVTEGTNITGGAFMSVIRGYSTAAQVTDRPGVILGYNNGGTAGIVAAATQSDGQALEFWTFSGSSWGSRMTISKAGNIVPGSGGLNTTDTDGFIYMQSCAGAPSGVPTTFSNRLAFVYDRTNNRIYVYNGGWKSVALA